MPCCDPAQMPECLDAMCCSDGQWACELCEAKGEICDAPGACCDPDDPLVCFEGRSCCEDGTWLCNDEQGQPTCPGELGMECEDPPGDCCDPDMAPDCPPDTNLTCCNSGYQCLGNDEICIPGIVCDEPGVCQNDGESCANGLECCPGLDCCEGQPIPPGQEYCSDMLCPISDRNRKEGFAPIDAKEVLDRVVAMPITTWSYTFEEGVRHIGPMAQDFRAAFDVGATDKAIFQVDADGVALASIQALHAEVEQLRKEKAELQETLSSLEARLQRLEAKK